MLQKPVKPKLVFILLILFLSLFSFNSSTFAMDITKGNKVEVVDNNTTISSKYKFIAQFNKSKTKVVPFGLKAKKLKSKSGKTPYLSFNPKNDKSLKGKFGVTYQNIGTYEGKNIDLKITVLGWKRYINNDSGKISFQLNNIGENNQGFYYVDQKWEFYESGTNKKVKINGYMTINDIDSLQSVRFSKKTSSMISSILVDEATKGFLSYSNANGEIAIYEDNYILTDSDEKRAMATILYEGLDTLRFKWERDYDRSKTSVNKIYDPDITDGEYFGYIAKKPARTEMLDPFKTLEVNGNESNNQDVTFNKIFSFNLYHQVPDEWSEFYYDGYSITDNIDSRLSIQSIKVVNEEGKDVKSYFDNKTSGNSIKLVAKSSNLNRSSFYNHTYNVVVNVKVKDTAALYSDVKNGKVSFNNIFAVTTNNNSKKSNQVTANLNQRKIDVWHLDKINQSTLDHTTDKLFDGDSYSYSSKDTLKKGDYSYTAVPKETKKGTVNGKDIELKFYYQLPLLDVNMQHIQIYTDDSEKGLPVKLKINRDYPYGTDIPELTKNKLKIELFEGSSNNALISKEYTLEDIPGYIDDWIIPKGNLMKNTHKNYVVKITGVDNKQITSGDPEINTDGYTATEQVFTILNDKDLSFKGVIMTEREIGKDMQKHYETLSFHNEALNKQKTGYGFELNLDIDYTNDLADLTNIKVGSVVDSNLIDSYLDYNSNDGFTVINLEETSKNESPDKKQTVYRFQLPHINVEKGTGYLYTDEQVLRADERITNDVLDGGRKLYVPIWADLDSYNIYLKSVDPIGVNKITFSAEKQLDIYAYMFGTIGSDSLDNDEILIEPINPNNPFPNGLPDGWSSDDSEWLSE